MFNDPVARAVKIAVCSRALQCVSRSLRVWRTRVRTNVKKRSINERPEVPPPPAHVLNTRV